MMILCKWIFIIFLNCGLVNQGVAEDKDLSDQATDVFNTIVDQLTRITCETTTVGELLRNQYTHTCIRSNFSVFSVIKKVFQSQGMYLLAFLKLAIHDEEILPENCTYKNRADPKDLKLKFALCSNKKLALANLQRAATPVLIYKIIKDCLIGGKGVWEVVKDALIIDKTEFYEVKTEKLKT